MDRLSGVANVHSKFKHMLSFLIRCALPVWCDLFDDLMTVI